MKIIDLRSDTVTRPGPGMRDAIATADVGDDVFGDDPTVNALEARVASMFGAEAALFVPSGTMGNLVALSSITSPGDEVILDRQSHIFNYEVASAAAIAGLQVCPLDGETGVLSAGMVEPHIRAENLHCPPTRVVAIENTHNRAGGRVYPFEEMRRIRALADDRGLLVHLDGARICNAHVASGVPLADYYRCADTLSMCFSKGLGAPVGSIVVSTAAVVARARKRRKQLGGGMRQAGLLAAAAMYALDHHIGRLSEDHEAARILAAAIERTEGLRLTHVVETNIVVFAVDPKAYSVEEFLGQLEADGVLAVPFGPGLVRMVTHLDVSPDDVERVVGVLEGLRPR
jgi:threonine aldolase